MACRLISVLVLLVACHTASADIFKWVDAEGVTHFGSQPPLEQAVKRVEIGGGRVKTKDVSNPYNPRIREADLQQELSAETEVVAEALTSQ